MKFKVGDWTAIATTNELAKGQECVRIEARAMDVLKLLYENRGAVVSKSELIDTVWKLQVVSDHSITVAISNLRRALNDDPKNPKYIETIPKRGYRLLDTGPERDDVDNALAQHGAPETEKGVPFLIKQHVPKWLMAFVVLCLMALVVWVNSVYEAPTDSPQLFVLDTENATSDPVLDPLAATITELTLDTLSQSEDIQLVRWRYEPDDKAFLNYNDNAWILTPKLVVGERGPLLTMQLKSHMTNRIQWSTTQSVSLRHFRLAEATAMKGLAAALGLTVSINQQPRFSALAEEMYWRARYLWSLRQRDPAIRAQQLLLEVLEIEPSFARAHTALADLYIYKTGGFFYDAEVDPLAKAKWHIEQAELLSPASIDLFLAKAHYALFVNGEAQEALASLIRVVELAPNNVIAWVSYANALASVGKMEDAVEAITIAQSVDPMDPALRLDKVWILFLAERYDEAIVAADDATDLGMSGDLYRGLVWGASGQYQKSVEAWVKHFKSTTPASVQLAARYKSALEAVNNGGHAAAYSILGELVSPSSAIIKAMLYSLAADYEQAHAVLEQTKTAEKNWVKLWAHRVPVLRRMYGYNASTE
ncbi:winged helix-turn-helix domain-containing protein [Kordiimonas aquimaris]|uniref:winged helix-turn-helix domain-containing protein n=1 Tax=Kordiimonas aquimaris TaxID=707591 RepID=UPI0021CE91B4|nr:winged helix-turn-helix domain-containing protein [Kordiimonas aquimaris]